ncbi:lipid-A-disaccharide synthase [Kangiella sediminilitoris]|uniref:Lipid-A-disaccharide synthase n=1 Tax=Kangiella sediminilitoris TaxID=1144748 RepID=A0A1B3BC20_9GAMM|nr:lipid-A-disaccharide synthase [Kangiella sediminilitoris]AOE50351.1 Lipid-A-disaccharide synthase [Kangiella sediminilitoris]
MLPVKSIQRIAIVAGEASGDILGAGLISELKKKYPDAVFEGIAGPLMKKEGCASLYPMESLSVMGLLPILKKLPELLKLRANLARYWVDTKPDLFIGIDAPEFNIGLEQKLKSHGIKTVHYVSPSVWAWRPKRIHKIKKSVDLMLCLFPFEQQIYQRHAIDNFCVGHPLADEIPINTDKQKARDELDLDKDAQLICIMPGSRGSELKLLGPDFIEMAVLLKKFYPEVTFIAPMANEKRRFQFQEQLAKASEKYPDLPNIRLIDGQSRTAMTAADYIVMASGTATLEAMLIKRPTVVAYKVGDVSYRVFKQLLTIDRFSIPNLLSKKELLPELIQDECTADNLFAEVRAWIGDHDNNNGQRWKETEAEFTKWHEVLKKNANVYAADSIEHWWSENGIRQTKALENE